MDTKELSLDGEIAALQDEQTRLHDEAKEIQKARRHVAQLLDEKRTLAAAQAKVAQMSDGERQALAAALAAA